MLLNLALIDYFKNLPYLALREVSKHFEDRDRVLLSVISPEWEKSINSQQINGCIRKVEAVGGNIEMIVSIDHLPPNSPIHTRNEVTMMNIKFINSDTDKIEIREEIEPEYSGITHVNRSITVHRQNCEVEGSQCLLEIANSLNRKFQLYLSDVTIENAPKMTQNDLLWLNSGTVRVGDNQLTDKDFNAFLHSWMKGNQDKMQHYSFKVGDDVKIDQVIRGLIARKWNPKKRDRKFITRDLSERPVDMANGYDITRPKTTSDNNLATFHITDNTLYFVVWDKQNSFEKRLKCIECKLKRCNRDLSREVPGTNEWNRITEERNKYLEEYRNLTGDPQAVYLVTTRGSGLSAEFMRSFRQLCSESDNV